MKILVFSDSHGRTLDMYGLIESEQPDAIIHLGDHYEDACDLRRSYPNLVIYAVRGNNDFDPDAPLFSVIAPAGVRMYLTHGHRERAVWSQSGNVGSRAAEEGCTVALYGHTHMRHDQTEGGVRVMNPGSISLPRDGQASCLRLEVQDGKLLEACFLDTDGAPLGPETSKPKQHKRFRWF
ncbi:MAG: metallophosphoesterase [Butyricicoccus sp.]|nr:metallophosphoesterase [Butyricicoccus sp.]